MFYKHLAVDTADSVKRKNKYYDTKKIFPAIRNTIFFSNNLERKK